MAEKWHKLIVPSVNCQFKINYVKEIIGIIPLNYNSAFWVSNIPKSQNLRSYTDYVRSFSQTWRKKPRCSEWGDLHTRNVSQTLLKSASVLCYSVCCLTTSSKILYIILQSPFMHVFKKSGMHPSDIFAGNISSSVHWIVNKYTFKRDRFVISLNYFNITIIQFIHFIIIIITI